MGWLPWGDNDSDFLPPAEVARMTAKEVRVAVLILSCFCAERAFVAVAYFS